MSLICINSYGVSLICPPLHAFLLTWGLLSLIGGVGSVGGRGGLLIKIQPLQWYLTRENRIGKCQYMQKGEIYISGHLVYLLLVLFLRFLMRGSNGSSSTSITNFYALGLVPSQGWHYHKTLVWVNNIPLPVWQSVSVWIQRTNWQPVAVCRRSPYQPLWPLDHRAVKAPPRLTNREGLQGLLSNRQVKVKCPNYFNTKNLLCL